MQKHIGEITIPKSMRDYAEKYMRKICVEHSAYDACNGYALGFSTTVEIKMLAEYCDICGYHSLYNPDQKHLLSERRHRLHREFVTEFYWSDHDSRGKGLEDSFEEFLKGGLKWENQSVSSAKPEKNGCLNAVV